MSLSVDGKSVSLSPDEIEIVLANDKQLKSVMICWNLSMN